MNFARVGRSYQSTIPTLRYLFEVEVHVYGFSVAANVLLSFFPFLIVLVSLCRYIFHWDTAEQAIYIALRDYFPGDTGDFLVRNLRWAVTSRGPFQWLSMLLLLFTANGVFEPLEVALNRAWGIQKTRSYVKNQLVSLGLIFACGGLTVMSAVFTAMNQDWITQIFSTNIHLPLIAIFFFKLAAFPTSIAILFLIYWILPFGNIPRSLAFRTAIYVSLVLEVLKYVHLLIWPWFRNKLAQEYGPFVNSATILLLSFAAAMVVMAGAEITAREQRAHISNEENRDKLSDKS